VKIKLLEYDTVKPFLQVKQELDKLALVSEIRVSEDLWNYWVNTLLDQEFYDNTDTNKTAQDLKHGLVADLYGIKVTTEIIIKNLTKATPLFDAYYMLFYDHEVLPMPVGQSMAIAGTTAPDLLDLARQVTQP
jgi:hypothetical protein